METTSVHTLHMQADNVANKKQTNSYGSQFIKGVLRCET